METSENSTFKTFEISLNELQDSLKNHVELQKYFPPQKIADILNTKLVNEVLDDNEIYDHRWMERKFITPPVLTDKFQLFWDQNSISDEMRLQMCKLYFLHEFYHLTQGIDSNTYNYSRNTKSIISQMDYYADAVAVKIMFLTEKSDKHWNEHLADILKSHILCGEVFSFADDNRQNLSISGERLKRQLIWHFQFARTKSYLPEKTFEDFDIEALILMELLKIEFVERRENLFNKSEVLPDELNMVEIQIDWKNQRIRHPMTVPYYSNNLKDGIFRYNFDSSTKAFRALFDNHLNLVGRGDPIHVGSTPQRNEKEITVDWAELEKLMVEVLPDGPNQDEFWSRIGANRARLRTNNLSGVAAWHVAITLLKNGGAGIAKENFLKKLMEEFSENALLINFCRGVLNSKMN